MTVARYDTYGDAAQAEAAAIVAEYPIHNTAGIPAERLYVANLLHLVSTGAIPDDPVMKVMLLDLTQALAGYLQLGILRPAYKYKRWRKRLREEATAAIGAWPENESESAQEDSVDPESELTRRQMHGRLGAAVRWGRPEAQELKRQMAAERAITALNDLRKLGGPKEQAVTEPDKQVAIDPAALNTDQWLETVLANEAEAGVHPARQRMRELLVDAGSEGCTSGWVTKQIAKEAQQAGKPKLAVHRNTVIKWLRADEEAGKARRKSGKLNDPYARWIWIRQADEPQP